MSDILNRIADYFVKEYQGNDETAPTIEITVDDMRYIASMNVDRCRAEAELRHLKSNGTIGVCEWKQDNDFDGMYKTCSVDVTYLKGFKYCPYCGKKIKVVE